MENKKISLRQLELVLDILGDKISLDADSLPENNKTAKKISKLFDELTLDRADLFSAATQAEKLFAEPEKARSNILFYLGYRETSSIKPLITRNIETLVVSNDKIVSSNNQEIEIPKAIKDLADFSEMQIGLTHYIPKNSDKTKPPLIFIAGLDHPASLFAEFFDKLAIESGQEIIVVDALGNGGSSTQNRSGVTSNKLLASTLATILATTSSGKSFQLGGYSLGSIPARTYLTIQDSFEAESQRKLAGKPLLVAPVPNYADTQHGLNFNPKLIRSILVDILTSGEMTVDDSLRDLFCQTDGESACNEIMSHTAKEGVPTNLVAPFTSTYAILGLSALRLADDGRATLILGEQDQLFPMEHPELLQKHPHIFVLPKSGHSSLGKRHVPDSLIKQAIMALNDARQKSEPAAQIDFEALYQKFKTIPSIAINAGSKETTVSARIAFRHGWGSNRHLGIGATYFSDLTLGTPYQAPVLTITQNTGLEINTEFFQAPIILGIGGKHSIQFGTDFSDSRNKFSVTPYAFFEWELIKSIFLRVSAPIGHFDYYGKDTSGNTIQKEWRWNNLELDTTLGFTF